MVILLALILALPGAAHALTPAEIDAAAAGAHNGLRTVVRKLAGKPFAGRDNSTPGSLAAQTYLIRKLRRLGTGLNGGRSDDAAFKQPFTHLGDTGTNLLAVMPGSDLASEYVMIGAHYDHLNSRSTETGGCFADGEGGGEICNGAADNASGVAATLAIAKAIKKIGPPRRSVILAFWDAEEDQLSGSAFYAANPLVPNAAVKGYINFDIQGANLLPTLKTVSFAVGAETGGPAFEAIVAQAVGAEGLDTQMLSYIFGQLRSDYVNLVNVGIPTVFFTDANNGCYHTVNDDVKFLDFKKLRRQTHIAFRTALALTEANTPPPFVAPGAVLATFADLQRVAGVVERGQPDLGLFPPADQTLIAGIRTTLQTLVADGPGAFEPADVGTLLTSAVDVVSALRRVPCRKF
jgi:Zn-dependent M28 family amino/carboxypeptidase